MTLLLLAACGNESSPPFAGPAPYAGFGPYAVGVTTLELGDRHELMEITHEGKRYVVAGGPWRQQRDRERRQCRIGKAEAELKRLAAVQRKKVNAQKLASQVGRSLQRLKAHKYFSYRVDAQGRLEWERKEALIAQEAQQDGWYLLHTNQTVQECPGEQVLGH